MFCANGLPETIQSTPVAGSGRIGGASSSDSSPGTQGNLQSGAMPGTILLDTRFDIVATHALVRQ